MLYRGALQVGTLRERFHECRVPDGFVQVADAELDWSIYSEQIQLADPTGVRARGLANYKRFFQLVRLFRSLAV